MTGRTFATDVDFFAGPDVADRSLLEALRRERRQAAISHLSAGIALGIGFSLAIDMAITTLARL